MRTNYSVLPVLFMAFTILFIGSPCRAGQVITKDIKAWARQAIEQEKSLGAIGAKNTLAVLYFHNKSGNAGLDPLQKGLAFMLITDLSQVEGLDLIERVKLQALVEEMDLGKTGLIDADTAPRAGQLLGAAYLVGGDISKGKTAGIGIRSDVLDVPTTNILGQPATEGELRQFMDMEKELLFDIIALLKVELTPEQVSELKKPLTRDMSALMNLFNAIDRSDRGMYREAASYYRRSLKKDPGLRQAKNALNELKNLNLIKPVSKTTVLIRNLEEKTSNTSTLTPEDSSLRSNDPGDLQKRQENTGQIHVQW